MHTIKATSPCCGDITIGGSQVRLVTCTQPQWSYYAYACPTCSDVVRNHASAEVVDLLGSVEVQAEAWDVPAEALEVHAGPVISWDEVLDFAAALATTPVVVLLAGVGPFTADL